MFAQMRHMAIVTGNANQEGDFYRDVLGMRRSSPVRAGGAVVVGDGYVGLNLNPRAPGRQAGFDHFGFEVQDVELVFSRLKEKYPKVQVLRRPATGHSPGSAPTIPPATYSIFHSRAWRTAATCTRTTPKSASAM